MARADGDAGAGVERIVIGSIRNTEKIASRGPAWRPEDLPLDCFVGCRLLAMTLLYACINKAVIASRASPWDQKTFHWIASSAPPLRNDASVRVNKQSRHREPQSGVAIQCKVHWIASSAAASSQ
jgi:hypothetical protein